MLAVAASAYLFMQTPDRAEAGKQLAILWAVVQTLVCLARILGMACVAAMVMAGAYLIRLWFGEAGLTWAALIVGGLLILGGLVVGGIYLYSAYGG